MVGVDLRVWVLAGVVGAAACGGSYGPADVEPAASGGAAALDGGAIDEIVAGADEAWVLTRTGDRYSERTLWRVGADTAAPELVGEVPRLQAARAVIGPDGIDVAGWRCADVDDEVCSESVAVLLRVDGSAAVTDEVVLAEKPGPLESSDGLTIVDGDGSTTIVEVAGLVVTVDGEGEVVGSVPSSRGEHCVVDGDLYGAVDPLLNSDTTDWPVVVEPDDENATHPNQYSVRRYDGEEWRQVDGDAFVELPGPADLTALCGDNQLEVVTRAGGLIATWTPSGWAMAAEAVDARSDLSPATSTDDRFTQSSDGQVRERASDGTWALTGLTLPTPPDHAMSRGPAILAVDVSDQLAAGCIFWLDADRNASTTCDAAAR